MDGRIYHLQNQMLRDLSRGWTIEDFAELTELSKSHLQRLFKAQTGKTPVVYLRELRLEAACVLLREQFSRLKEISFQVGIYDESHFTRHFKKKYGMTPTAYRKECWESLQKALSD